MPDFVHLPLDVLPLIIQHTVKASHLAALCLVNRSFYAFAVPLLYERIVIFSWYKDAKTRMMQVFDTLATSPHLASLVRRLEIRDFPKAFLISEKYQTLRENCVRGIQNATHLRSCTWTRDGSLQDPILKALQSCPELCELEINGHHEDNYDPSTLTAFRNLQKISLIMPSGPVLDLLPQWLEHTGHSLRNLTLICKSSPLVNDSLLGALSPNLPCLEHLYLVGCPRVTHEGVWSAIRNNVQGIEGLGIEGLSSSFDIVRLGQLCGKAGGLTKLKSITLTMQPDSITESRTDGVMDMLSESPLEMFQIYATENSYNRFLGPYLCSRLVALHGHRLLRFSVHRLRISMDTLSIICAGCPNLQQLFVHISPFNSESFGPVLAQARKLRTAHINLALRPPRIQDEALAVIKQCSPTIVQFGLDTRVWQVSREVVELDDGTLVTRPVLKAYENPDIPEQFLVVRA